MADSIVMASDHRGTRLKAELRTRLEAQGHAVVDKGPGGEESVDYPDFGAPAARAVSSGEVPRGIVICGSGLGMMYTANRFPSVRAAWAQDEEMARLARRHLTQPVHDLDRQLVARRFQLAGDAPQTRLRHRPIGVVGEALDRAALVMVAHRAEEGDDRAAAR